MSSGVWRVIFLLAFALSGCGSSSDEHRAAEPVTGEDVLRTQVERGPVRLAVELAPAKPRLSDEPRLTVTIQADKGVTVEKPPFGSALGDFLVRDFHEPQPVAADNIRTIRQVYTLEPTSAGTLAIDPITVKFRDDRPGGDGQEHQLQSEALSVEVSTMHEADAPSLDRLRPAAEPRELPGERSFIVWWAAGCVAAMLLCVAGLRYCRRGSTPEQRPTPQELARDELDRIIAAGLARTDVKLFYVELTGVVRRYIERSTGVRAPEQTTEEFLREIACENRYNSVEQQRLRDFLESADLVKFASLAPSDALVENSIQHASRFISSPESERPEVTE